MSQSSNELVPDGDEHVGGNPDNKRTSPACQGDARQPCRESKRLGRYRQDRTHSHARRCPPHAGSGGFGLRPSARRRSSSLRFVTSASWRSGGRLSAPVSTHPQFADRAAAKIAELTGLPFASAPNKFAVHGAHDALVMLSGPSRHSRFPSTSRERYSAPVLRTAVRLPRTRNPGERARLIDHAGQGQPDPVRGLGHDRRAGDGQRHGVSVGGAGGYLEMNVYKPLMINTILTVRADHGRWLPQFPCLPGRRHQAEQHPDQAVLRPFADAGDVSPVIGYDKASKAAHYAYDKDMTLKAACLELGYVDEAEFDRVVNPAKMIGPPSDHPSSVRLLNDPLYLGLRRRRPSTEELYAFVDEFVEGFRKSSRTAASISRTGPAATRCTCWPATATRCAATTTTSRARPASRSPA